MKGSFRRVMVRTIHCIFMHTLFSPWKLMQTGSFLIPVHAALTVRSAGNAILPSSTFCFPTVIHVGLFLSLHPTLRQKLLSRGILTARFECHFLWQNNLTLSA